MSPSLTHPPHPPPYFIKPSLFAKKLRTRQRGVALDSQSSGSLDSCSKPLGSSKVDSVFHPFEVNQMSTRNFRELVDKNTPESSYWLSSLLRQLKFLAVNSNSVHRLLFIPNKTLNLFFEK